MGIFELFSVFKTCPNPVPDILLCHRWRRHLSNPSLANYLRCHTPASWGAVCHRAHSCVCCVLCCSAEVLRVSVADCRATSEALWVSLPPTRLSQTTTCLPCLLPTSACALLCSAHIKAAPHFECTASGAGLQMCGSYTTIKTTHVHRGQDMFL